MLSLKYTIGIYCFLFFLKFMFEVKFKGLKLYLNRSTEAWQSFEQESTTSAPTWCAWVPIRQTNKRGKGNGQACKGSKRKLRKDGDPLKAIYAVVWLTFIFNDEGVGGEEKLCLDAYKI